MKTDSKLSISIDPVALESRIKHDAMLRRIAIQIESLENQIHERCHRFDARIFLLKKERTKLKSEMHKINRKVESKTRQIQRLRSQQKDITEPILELKHAQHRRSLQIERLMRKEATRALSRKFQTHWLGHTSSGLKPVLENP